MAAGRSRTRCADDPRIRFLGYVKGAAKRAAHAGAGHLLLPLLITSRIRGITEFVREGRTGRLFPPGDAAALAAAMETSMHNDALSQNLTRHGDALVAEFTVARMVEAFLARYDGLLGRAA